jgi:hypothetical protein
VLHDGEQVTLGGTTLVAHLTPGHTRGCTTWTTTAQEGGKTYNVMFGCSLRPPAVVTPANVEWSWQCCCARAPAGPLWYRHRFQAAVSHVPQAVGCRLTDTGRLGGSREGTIDMSVPRPTGLVAARV